MEKVAERSCTLNLNVGSWAELGEQQRESWRIEKSGENKMERGRPRKLTSKIADQIIIFEKARVKRGDPMLKAPAMRRHLLRGYRENLRVQGMTDDKIQSKVEHADKEVFPGVSSIQKFIAKIKDSPLDKPFSLGALIEHPIPPETLLNVLEAWVQYRKQGVTLTIREALWFSRLSSALLKFEKVGDKNKNLGNLVQWYAIRERAYEIIGEDIDTDDLDTEALRLLKQGQLMMKQRIKAFPMKRPKR